MVQGACLAEGPLFLQIINRTIVDVRVRALAAEALTELPPDAPAIPAACAPEEGAG